MDKCKECQMPLDDESTCKCDKDLCKYCCQCDDDCQECDCKKDKKEPEEAEDES